MSDVLDFRKYGDHYGVQFDTLYKSGRSCRGHFHHQQNIIGWNVSTNVKTPTRDTIFRVFQYFYLSDSQYNEF